MSDTTDTSICNIALSRFGSDGFASLAYRGFVVSGSPLDYCMKSYAIIRDSMVAEFAWSWSRKVSALVAATAVTGYDYAYTLPADLMSPLRLVDSTSDWRIIGALLVTNDDVATLEYQASGVDSDKFPATFRDAMAWRLAADMCSPVAGKEELRGGFLQQAALSLHKAIQQDSVKQQRTGIFANFTQLTNARK